MLDNIYNYLTKLLNLLFWISAIKEIKLFTQFTKANSNSYHHRSTNISYSIFHFPFSEMLISKMLHAFSPFYGFCRARGWNRYYLHFDFVKIGTFYAYTNCIVNTIMALCIDWEYAIWMHATCNVEHQVWHDICGYKWCQNWSQLQCLLGNCIT